MSVEATGGPRSLDATRDPRGWRWPASCTASTGPTSAASRRRPGRARWPRVRETDPAELAGAGRRAATLTELPGIGDASARSSPRRWPARCPSLPGQAGGRDARCRSRPRAPRYRAALRGDCHSHSTWSDGGASIEAMATTAHDARPRVPGAHRPLAPPDDRPRPQPRAAASSSSTRSPRLNERLAPFRILTGMEVDILEDGALDLDDDLLARLDVVVASVHSKLRMERQQMTERMVLAVASPHVDILGHCTGRLIGKRPGVGRSTPTTCSPPAPSSAPRSRSTAAPSGSTRRGELLDAGHRLRLLLLDRHRRPRHRPAGVAAPRLRPRRRARRAARTGHQHLVRWTTCSPWVAR